MHNVIDISKRLVDDLKRDLTLENLGRLIGLHAHRGQLHHLSNAVERFPIEPGTSGQFGHADLIGDGA